MQTQAQTTTAREISTLDALCALYDVAWARGGLDAAGVWRLAQKHNQELTDRTDGHTPAGGWRSLAALAVGVGVLKATSDELKPGTVDPSDGLDDPANRSHPVPPSVLLAEAFTRYLIPPACAASMFLALDIHPLWGLRSARAQHVGQNQIGFSKDKPWTDDEMLPNADLCAIAQALQAFLANFWTVCIHEPTTTVDALAETVNKLADTRVDELDRIDSSGLDIVVDGSTQRSRAFFVQEFLGSVAIPAGLAERHNDTIEFDPDLMVLVDITLDDIPHAITNNG